jgi:hypothetical protein
VIRDWSFLWEKSQFYTHINIIFLFDLYFLHQIYQQEAKDIKDATYSVLDHKNLRFFSICYHFNIVIFLTSFWLLYSNPWNGFYLFPFPTSLPLHQLPVQPKFLNFFGSVQYDNFIIFLHQLNFNLPSFHSNFRSNFYMLVQIFMFLFKFSLKSLYFFQKFYVLNCLLP